MPSAQCRTAIMPSVIVVHAVSSYIANATQPHLTYFLNTEHLSRSADRCQLFIGRNGLPRHDGRVARINDSLAATREYLSANLRYDGRLKVDTVCAYLHKQQYIKRAGRYNYKT